MCESKWDKSKLFHPDYDASGGDAFKRLGTSTARYGCCPANKYMTKPFLNEDTFNPDNSCNSACPAGKFGTTQSGPHDNICQLCERGKSSNAGSTSCSLTTSKLPNGNGGSSAAQRTGDTLGRIVDDILGTDDSKKEIATTTYGPIETWDVSDVTDISHLFRSKNTFNSDISDWNVAKVTTMERST